LGAQSRFNTSATVCSVLLASFDGLWCKRRRGIYFSIDRISPDHIDTIVVHELTHYLTEAYWESLHIIPAWRDYWNEGIAVAFSQRLTNSPLFTALGMSESSLFNYQQCRDELQSHFKLFARSRLDTTYAQTKGAIDNVPPDPFTATGHKYQRYGYVLAALEVIEALAANNLEARIKEHY
jgi:hypothetical protein